MSRQDTHIARFVMLSAAVHAAVLLVGNRPETNIGTAGPMVQVYMTYQSAAAGPAAAATNPAARTPARQDRAHATTNRSTPVRTAATTDSRRHANAPRETTATQPATARQGGDARAPGQSAPAANGTEPARQSAEEQLRKRILQLVSSRFDYPVLARRKGWQGIVTLQVHIESNGRISSLQVKQTSGYPVLDQAAVQSLHLASVPDAEQWMQGQAIDIIIPVEYRLVGG